VRRHLISSPYPGTRAIVRAVTLLKAFSDAQPAWRLSALARAARLHKATAHRLLAALERAGMVARDPSGELYRLGPEAIALGARAARATDLRAISRPQLEALAAATGEAATLEVPTGADMLILDEVLGRALLGTAPSVGTRWPAHATSTGKAFLAALPQEEAVATLGGRLARWTARTITTHARLARELGRVRRRGYATAVEELERGYVAVGAAVRDQSGRPVAAISLGGPRVRFPAPRIAALGREVRHLTALVSAALGYREPA
jgi:IclR family transcriptional regulator, acetate operon repressor